jgi:hypothetical protein
VGASRERRRPNRLRRTVSNHNQKDTQMKRTERTAKTPPAKTGLSAMLRAFLSGAKGSGAPSQVRARADRTLIAALASLLPTAAALALAAAPASASEPCPNEALRAENRSTNLPDCRAYEMVTPLDKNGYFVTRGNLGGAIDPADDAVGAWAQASAAGDGIAYTANGAFPGSAASAAGDYYLSARGPNGWSTQGLLPPQRSVPAFAFVTPSYAAYSADLSRGILWDGTDSPALVSGEPPTGTGYGFLGNLFLRDNSSGSYQLIDAPAPGTEPGPYFLTFDGASADFSHVVFDTAAQLTPEAPAGGIDNLYEWVGGAVTLVSQIPSPPDTQCGGSGPPCIPAPEGAAAGRSGGANVLANGILVHAISGDGSSIFFTANGNLYLRANGTTTVQVDASQASTPGAGGGGLFLTAAGDGSKVFFFDDASAGLTDDTVPGSGQNLYSYDTTDGTLTDLTPAAEAGALGVVGASSNDGSYLYFVATGDLASGATAGQPNLYLSHNGTTSFIAANPDVHDYSGLLSLFEEYGARVTPDGRHLAFTASGSLFEYSADSGEIQHVCDCATTFPQPFSATLFGNQAFSIFQYTRGISDDGSRLFFDSPNALLPRDTNGLEDVYEYEQAGAGSCNTTGGCLSLLSDGVSPTGSQFVDASASGNDVFFTTGGQLVPQDTDHSVDLYDARTGGGFPSPPTLSACEGDACQSPPAAPNDPTPASTTYNGPGNLTEPPPKCKKGFFRKRRRCVKEHHKKTHKRHANTNGRAVR